jgi:chromosome condensin MukBEF ATPase and DNA-binding subunit MukB
MANNSIMDDLSDVDVDSAEQRLAMRRRQAQLGIRMQRVAIAALEELERKVAAGQPLGVIREQAEKMLAAGQKIERAATAGDPPKTPN